MKKTFKSLLPGIIITAICFVVSIVFVLIVEGTKMLTANLIWIAVAVLLIWLIGIFLLTKNIKRKVRFVIGCVLAIILVLLELFGAYYVGTGASTLNKITTPNIEYAEIGIYVRKNDKAKVIDDIKEYTFGVLETLDRDATNLAVKKLNGELGVKIATANFSGITEQMNALITDKSVGAVIVNKSFLELLSETEEHRDDLEKIREIYSVKIKNNSSTGVQAPPPDQDTFSVYISGIDCHGSVSRRSRSDVNIIATVNTKTGQVLLLSTPRDYFVPLSISNGVPDKLTHAGIYGINVSKDTLAMLYETDIDYYFRVNFDGFKGIIDALGGVTVQSQYAFSAGGTKFVKGENTLNGTQALAFSRERYSFAGGDRQRGKNQMAVIQGVLNKAMSPALLKNYNELLNSIKGSFETNVPYETIADLVKKQLKDGTKWNVASYSVDGTGASMKPYSMSMRAYVMIPDEITVEHAKMLIEQVKDGQVPQP
ncbi:MAG: LytR family transcriptional regulator [Ruminococcaceae bacterium]|nr:LytR family transcriptional regulator [Oscillospiraceae bacterium]